MSGWLINMIQKPKGTFDIMPEEMGIWEFIEKTAREVSHSYGYSGIRTPVFEATELFTRGVGDTTDVVQKEMYTFTDKDGRSLTLRPEGTASIARSIIESGKVSDAMPLRLFYFINCFRYEKPQAGRSREFWQYGVELYGAPTPFADAEVISLADTFIKKLGINSIQLNINSIGCPKCRPNYRDALKNYFTEHSHELCETCNKRLNTNPLRILDCKSPICSEIASNAPKTIDYLCDDCKSHMDTLTSCLKELKIDYVINPKIVRGLDYYTRTVFEFISPNIGAQSTICGGGRYDGLVHELGGPEIGGIGFAMGITRLIMELEAMGIAPKSDLCPTIYIAPMGDNAKLFSLSLADKLRAAGIRAESDIVGRSLKAQMKYSDKKGAHYSLIIGDSELESKKATLKNMKTSDQTEINLTDTELLIKKLQSENFMG